jgi:hypothetical protein
MVVLGTADCELMTPDPVGLTDSSSVSATLLYVRIHLFYS